MSMSWKDTNVALKARLLADHQATLRAHKDSLVAEAKARQFAKPVAGMTAREQAYAREDLRTQRALKRRNKDVPDPNAKFMKGDLVQCTRMYLMRQRATGPRKTEETKGLYYGRANTKGGVYVDWFVSEPFERLQRQVVQEDYIEPLGTPR